MILGGAILAVAATAHASTPSRAAGAAAVEAAGDPVIAIGGDIACPPGKTVNATHCQQSSTGSIITNSIHPDYVVPLGDTQYDSGTAAEYAGSYNVTGWGTDKSVSRPAAGNHEYRTAGATGYYGYFGSNAGDPVKGFYSWDVAGPNNSFRWHMIALNSECAVLGGGSISQGCGAGSSQEQWLKADLAANSNVCTIAYWHRPRFSSSTTTPSSTTYTAFWNDLYSAGADLVLNGHAHDYERFAPQTSSGAADAKGLTELIVGTGGEDFQTMGSAIANSVVRNNTTFGVLKMTLHANTYDYQFLPAAGATFTDSGSGTCDTAPAPDTTAPSAPTGLRATAAGASQVGLSWTAATDNVGVKNYRIYRGAGGATPSLIATTTTAATSFTDTTTIADTQYTYQVQALDAAGNAGPLSAAATVTTPSTADTTPPSAPSSLAAEEVFYNEIDLGWTGSTDSGTGVSGYRVYRMGPGQSAFTLLATTTGTGAGHNSYQDLTVVPSSTYQYRVTAYDGADNESAASNTITAGTPAGPASKTFTFTPTDDATIDLTHPTTNAGAGTTLIADNSPVNDFLMHFNVATSGCVSLTSATLKLTNNADGSTKGGDFYSTGPNWSETTVNWNNAPTRGALLNSLGAVGTNTVTTVNLTSGVPLNGTADFRVGSTTGDGVHYWSKEAPTAANRPQLTVMCSTSAPAPDATAPTAPTSLAAASATAGEIAVKWTASTDNVAPTDYEIFRNGAEVGTVPWDSLTYRDTTVTNGQTYSYTVKAVDAAGNRSPASAAATATASTILPPGPTGLTAKVAGPTVHLDWAASSGESVVGYYIYRQAAGGTPELVDTTTKDKYVDKPGAGTYDYWVTAGTLSGAESTPSNTVTVTVNK